MSAAESLAQHAGTLRACRAMRVSRASLYRRRRAVRAKGSPPLVPASTASTAAIPGRATAQQVAAAATLVPSHPRALTAEDRAAVLAMLTSERFVDQAPAAVHAMLLDEGRYLCSVSTMYRILAAARATRERRQQRRRPHYAAPQLMATAPNQVWSWDITKLPGPAKSQ